MSHNDTEGHQEHLDFFISYTGSDRQWAEWIAMQLEEAGYTLFIQAWDFRPGSNFVAEMDRAAKSAERTLLVLSPAYLLSDYAFAEWAAAFRRDPKGTHRRLLLARIQPCEVEGLLGPMVYIDLVQLDEEQARERLLAGVKQGRVKPTTVAYPGQDARHEPHTSAVFPGSLPTIWNIPFVRNPFFMGRKELLERLHTQLRTTQAAALSQPQAISGLGGIGKTQLAVEYAYQHGQEYQAVLWAYAETTETLTTSYSEIARLLQLPQKDAQEQEVIVQAVKAWLRESQGWLLIVDNVDEPDVLTSFLPSSIGGQVLVTTRAMDLTDLGSGFGHAFAVQAFSDEQGALFLLHRSNLLPADVPLEQAEQEVRQRAKAIVHELGGLPLALDQAGAYLSKTGCGLVVYQQMYQRHRTQLLKVRRGADHPEPVATTWNISFRTVEQQNPAAADLLRLCAFLAPDAIPEEVLTEGAQELGEVLAPVAADVYLLDQAIMALRAYSLLFRYSQTHTLSVHRLVQAVLRDSLPTEIQRRWMQRAVQAVAAAYPGQVYDLDHWLMLERLLPHALVCATWIEQASLVMPEASRLLKQTANYLFWRGRYGEAEPLYQRALAIDEQELGASHPDTATSLNNLAALYYAQGKYGEAEPLYQRALAIRKRKLEATHPDIAQSLNNLALLYKTQGKYGKAEPLYQRALAIQERKLGATHPDIAQSLDNLATFYRDQGKYGTAEPLYQRALAIREQELEATHPDIAQSLDNLATFYCGQGKYEEAEPLYQHALAIFESILGRGHPSTQIVRKHYASLLQTMRRGGEAKTLEESDLEEANIGYRQGGATEELEAFITMQGDKELYDDAVRRRIAVSRVLALGAPVQGVPERSNLLHCTVPVGDTTIAMLPVFTRAEHITAAVQMNPAWQSLQVLQMDGSVILGDLEEGEYLGINPWSEHEFKLPAIPSTYQQVIDSGHPNEAPIAATNLGLLMEEQGDLEGAKAAYQQAIDSGHADQAPKAAVNLGLLLQEQGDHAGAQAAYQRAIDSGHAEWAPKAHELRNEMKRMLIKELPLHPNAEEK